MEWNNLKAPSWDLSEIEETSLNNIETMESGGSRRFGDYRTKGEFSVDLKLGQVGNSSKSKDVTKMMTSSTGSSKRARAINNGTQIVSCLVDGCQADLSNCRDYHRRHKVCELHSKTAQVIIGGNKQRFCQQCSRFHSLEEFDEGKRSCRKRLDGHNRRRRKPQAEAISRSGSFLSNYQGTQLLPFSTSSQIYPSTTMMNPTWVGGDAIRFHNNSHNQHTQMHHNHHLVEKQDLFLGITSSTNNTSYKQHGTTSTHHNNNQHHFLPPAGSITNPFSERYKMSCDNNNNNTCALSLLSSPPTQTHDGLMNQMVNTHHHHHHSSFMQPLGLSLQDHVLGSNEQSAAGIYNLASSNDSHSQEENNNHHEPPPYFPFNGIREFY